jgi:hypothetical protein
VIGGWLAWSYGVGIAALAGCYGGLLSAGVVSWRRTRPVRHGSRPPSSGPPQVPGQARGDRSSRTTFLPGCAGLALAALAAPTAASGHWAWAWPLGASALLVGLTGLRSRVAALVDEGARLTIRYAHRAPFGMPWPGCMELRPPLVPWGGWRILTDRRESRTLMPSDLLGHEWILPLLIERSGLRFQRRAWRRREADRG